MSGADNSGNDKRGDGSLDAMAQAEPVPAPDFAAASAAPEKDAPAPWLPEPCPVTPLGMNGAKLVLLDGLQQIQTVATRCDKGDLMAWFGSEYLEESFGTEGKDRWDQRKAQTALIEDCRNLGIFDPRGRVFGRGAHRGPHGGRELMMHLGARVVVSDPAQPKAMDRERVLPAGAVKVGGERYFFPGLPPLPAPDTTKATAKDVENILSVLGTFNFIDKEGSQLLMLGMIAQMYICGALPWRSHIWLVAPTGTGKTTLQSIIRELLASWCLHTEDASEAAIRQTLNDDTLPVLIDEAEAHDKPEKLQNLLNLMKKASSGAKIHRGGADHKATEFTAQSCFLLSSVIHAPLRGEDRNRLAILQMRPFDTPPEPLAMERATWRTVGRRFHRRMIAHWPRFNDTWDMYKRAIATCGFDGRAQDTYGTLLACADMLQYDHAPNLMMPDSTQPGEERVMKAVQAVLPLMERGRSEAQTDVERVISYLASTMLPGAGGQPPEPTGLWIERAMELVGGIDMVPDGPNDAARAKLKSYGLRVVNLTATPKKTQPAVTDALPENWNTAYLAVAYGTNRALAELFKGSDWSGGAWTQSLGKIPGAVKVKMRFAGSSDNAICVPMRVFKEEEG